MSKKICIFGDSITQGYYDLEKGGWANRLFVDSMNEGGERELDVYNLGINGDTSVGLLERMEQELSNRGVDVIIISIGTNDSLIENGRNWVDIKVFRENLEKMLSISHKFDAKIFFTGVFGVNEELSAPLTWDDKLYSYNKELKKYDLIIENFCREKEIVFVSLWEILKQEDLSDGFHPNAEGHEKIFKKVKSVLKENRII